MWQIKMFIEDQMVMWENKTAAQQTWAELQSYFTKKWLKCKEYSTMTAKQSCFKKQHLLYRRQYQLKTKAICKQYCLQCCRNSTTDKLRQ